MGSSGRSRLGPAKRCGITFFGKLRYFSQSERSRLQWQAQHHDIKRFRIAAAQTDAVDITHVLFISRNISTLVLTAADLTVNEYVFSAEIHRAVL